MARISFWNEGNTAFEQLLGHNPEVLSKWSDLEETLFNSKSLELELKEEVRKTLALSNQCHYWMSKGEPKDNIENVKILLAKSFALLVAENHLEVDDKVINTLKEEFSDGEISELCAFICFIIASQKFGAVLNI